MIYEGYVTIILCTSVSYEYEQVAHRPPARSCYYPVFYWNLKWTVFLTSYVDHNGMFRTMFVYHFTNKITIAVVSYAFFSDYCALILWFFHMCIYLYTREGRSKFQIIYPPVSMISIVHYNWCNQQTIWYDNWAKYFIWKQTWNSRLW